MKGDGVELLVVVLCHNQGALAAVQLAGRDRQLKSKPYYLARLGEFHSFISLVSSVIRFTIS